MKMSKKYFGFAGAIWIAGMLWAPAVRAQIVAPHFGSHAGMMRGGGGMMLPMLLRSANLTADQKTKTKSPHDEPGLAWMIITRWMSFNHKKGPSSGELRAFWLK